MPASKSRSRTPVSKVTPQKKGKSSASKGKKPSESKSRSKTPVAKNAKNSKSVTPVKTQKSAAKPEGNRKFYTVSEDQKIFSAWKSGSAKNQTVSDMAKSLAKTLGRSEESVRDRIKRYLSKLNAGDENKLTAAAKSTPNHHVHFVNDKQGHPWKTIGQISSEDPSFFKAGASTAKKNPTSARKASPAKQKSASKSPAPKSSNKASGSVLKKRTPQKSASQSRSNTPAKSNKKVKSASKGNVPTWHMKGADKELQGKVNTFLGGLGSKKDADVKKNAEVLAEVVKGFSSSYGVELSDVMTLLAKEKDGVNCARVRSQLERM